MLENKQLLQLFKATANANPSVKVAFSYGDKNFSYDELQNTLRKELNELVGTPQLYRENMNTFFTLIEETLTDILPKKVIAQYGQFAEIQHFNQGEQAIFTQRITEASKRRAKKFVTKVGLAGVYEVFRLDGKSVTVQPTAYGGAAQIAFEEFLDGKIDMSDVFNIVLEGLDEAVYKEIAKALKATVTNLPSANKHAGAGWNETAMDRLISVAKAYGEPTIYCTEEFAATIAPTNSSAINYDAMSDSMKEQRWLNGHFGTYKGHSIVILEQSFEDETNATKVIDPRYAYIIPGGRKPVKVAFEGSAQVRNVDNEDWSKEIQTYIKFGVATIVTNDICVYQNTSLSFTDQNDATDDTFEA